MSATEAYGDLLRMGVPVVTTTEAATRMKCGTRTAYKRLKQVEKAGLVSHVKQGLWLLDPELPPFALAAYLTAPMPACVSLSSALAHHGLIEQIPRQVSVVSPGRTRRILTGLGMFAIHRIAPELFGGFEGEASTGYVATPEKALFDSVYIRTAAGSVAYFPELTLPEGFDPDAALSWIERIGSARLRTITGRRLEAVLSA